ncbi:HAD family hydrolase [Streptomyces litchfieldiae]|uniref:HAD family hydrolase n=1 Tax=Streptomyces litchfieldiae TaxID=3075543 RepID=A0ABU2ML71_9ACTN|nr:HAD family hydrolase [Streptomyces sp. DSM 44938]MDT0342226.1 HAD family hydrolase [Streptomyces sp. DSM 44938]
MIRAVMFDVGECLVDESREWGGWADWLGVPRHTFSARFGALIAQGRDPYEIFHLFHGSFDHDAEREKRDDIGDPEWFGENDLYPDVRITIKLLRDAGLTLGIAANQSKATTKILRTQFTGYLDVVATSYDWGVEKPDPRFFELLVELVGLAPQEILYVGDRLDTDIRPAAAVGLRTALIRRGPWALIQDNAPDAAALPTLVIDGLRQLPDRVEELNAAEGRPGNSAPVR